MYHIYLHCIYQDLCCFEAWSDDLASHKAPSHPPPPHRLQKIDTPPHPSTVTPQYHDHPGPWYTEIRTQLAPHFLNIPVE